MAYIKTVCKAGRTKIIRKYYCYHAQPRGQSRAPKGKETCESQKKVNDRQLEQKLTALMNHNCNKDWWYVTWSYAPEHGCPLRRSYISNIAKLLRDLRRTYKKHNTILKYFWTPEVGSRGAAHIHMVISPIDLKLIRGSLAIWLDNHKTHGALRAVQPPGKLFYQVLPENEGNRRGIV